MEPRVVLAANAGLFTLDGTRTFLVGRRRVAVIDPGPNDPAHVAAVAAAVAGADEGTILLTHGHGDHAGGTAALAEATGFPLAGAIPGMDRTLRAGDRVEVDGGWLVAVATPGHARNHLAFDHQRGGSAGAGGDLFVGDLLLGEGKTTWVGEYPGCVADYLASLDRIEALAPKRVFPAHGPVIDDPPAVIARFRDHRLARIEEIREAAGGILERDGPGATERPEALVEAVIERVYGSRMEEKARVGARWSIRAILEYLELVPFPMKPPTTQD